MEAAADWQLAHPEGTAEQCRAWLQAEQQKRAGMEGEGGRRWQVRSRIFGKIVGPIKMKN